MECKLISHNWTMTLNLVSVVTGTAAALLPYWSSLSVPWKLRSWTGETSAEKRYERTQKIMASVGIPCVFIAALCQSAVAIDSSN
jgi:hypothetical protein